VEDAAAVTVVVATVAAVDKRPSPNLPLYGEEPKPHKQ